MYKTWFSAHLKAKDPKISSFSACNIVSMGKALEMKGKILKFLTQAASKITFTNTLTSPRVSTSSGKGLTSPRPIISIIPAEARTKPKNGSFEAKEPTSPEVSCFGQVNKKKKKSKLSNKRVCPPPQRETLQISCPKEVKKQKPKPKSPSMFKFLKGHKKSGKYDGLVDEPVAAERVPSLGQMNQFSSARGVLTNFEWTAQCGFDEEGKEGIDGDEKVIVPFSAPIEVRERVAVQPKREINLWRRRAIAPPVPLQL